MMKCNIKYIHIYQNVILNVAAKLKALAHILSEVGDCASRR